MDAPRVRCMAARLVVTITVLRNLKLSSFLTISRRGFLQRPLPLLPQLKCWYTPLPVVLLSQLLALASGNRGASVSGGKARWRPSSQSFDGRSALGEIVTGGGLFKSLTGHQTVSGEIE